MRTNRRHHALAGLNQHLVTTSVPTLIIDPLEMIQIAIDKADQQPLALGTTDDRRQHGAQPLTVPQLRQWINQRPPLGRTQRLLQPGRIHAQLMRNKQGLQQLLKVAHRLTFAVGQLTRRGIVHTERADPAAIGRMQSNARIKTHKRIAGYGRIIEKALIGVRILHVENIVGQNGVTAERNVARPFKIRRSDAPLEPLAIRVDQGHQRTAHAKHPLSDAQQCINMRIRWRIQQLHGAERGQTLLFICRYGRLYHCSSPITAQPFQHHF